VEVERSSREGGAGELLGDVVPSLPQRDTGLGALYARFQEQGFAILAISDEEAGKWRRSPRSTTSSTRFCWTRAGESTICSAWKDSKSFVYDRNGKIVATAIDMRTQKQFLAMLAKRG